MMIRNAPLIFIVLTSMFACSSDSKLMLEDRIAGRVQRSWVEFAEKDAFRYFPYREYEFFRNGKVDIYQYNIQGERKRPHHPHDIVIDSSWSVLSDTSILLFGDTVSIEWISQDTLYLVYKDGDKLKMLRKVE